MPGNKKRGCLRSPVVERSGLLAGSRQADCLRAARGVISERQSARAQTSLSWCERHLDNAALARRDWRIEFASRLGAQRDQSKVSCRADVRDRQRRSSGVQNGDFLRSRRNTNQDLAPLQGRWGQSHNRTIRRNSELQCRLMRQAARRSGDGDGRGSRGCVR